MKFIVFGLGNSQFESFCGLGVTVDKRLADLGAQRLY